MGRKEKENLLEMGLQNLNRFFENGAMSKLNKVFHIDKWNPVSILFFYLGSFGLILFLLTIWIIPYYFIWFYVFFLIILLGFIFAKPNPNKRIRYNFTLVIVILTILAFIPSNWGQTTLLLSTENPKEDILEGALYGPAYPEELKPEEHQDQDEGEEIYNFSNLYNKIQDLQRNPFANLAAYMTNFMDVINIILFLFICAYGLSTIGDALTFQYSEIAKKIGFIAIAITIMTFAYGIFLAGGIQVRTVWDTMGSAWNLLMRNLGLASDKSPTKKSSSSRGGSSANNLDVNVNFNTYTVVNGFFSWIPLLMVLFCFSMAIYFRHRAFNSILFARYVSEEDTIDVERTKFSIPVLIIFLPTIIFVVGYFLTTADPQVVIDPTITLVFYISALAILPLLGWGILILNKSQNFGKFLKNMFIWTFLGLMGLFLWFQIFQPAMYEMGLLDYPSGQMSLNQGFDEAFLESPIISQLFLVALPETLIFQIAVMGIVNRVYFQFRKGNLIERERERLLKKKETLLEQLTNIPIDKSISRKNLRNLAKQAVIKKEIDKIDLQLAGTEKIKLPYSYFVIPSLIAALFGSFLFSDYHRFRRDISFQTWWQNPMLGLTYMGAGYFLSLVAFFSWPAAILVHWLNNAIAMIFGG